jgi:hypothetical protein
MRRLPTVRDCPECGSQKRDAEGVSVFCCLGPVTPQHEQTEPPRKREDFEEEEDKYHRPRCALMDLTIPRNVGYSGCAVWRKPRPDISRC